MASPPKIFLSYASEDGPWVNWFTRKEWFAQQIGIVTLENYLVGDNLEFGELTKWVDEQISEATVVVAFVSEFYRKKDWTKVEWDKTLTEFRRRRLIFVPVMLDSEARAWWEDLRRRGDLNVLPIDYMYSNFSDDRGERLSISTDDRVQEQIAKLAREIKGVLFAAPPAAQTPSPDSLPRTDGQESVVVLGHPTSRFAEGVAGQASDLVQAVRAEGLSVQQWKDGWLKNSASRGEPDESPSVSAVFVQPLAAGEASEEVAEAGKTRKRLADAGVAAAPLVLWLPSGQADPDFEKAAAASTETLPDLLTLRAKPALRTDPPRNLSLHLRTILRPTAGRDDPVVQIETVGSTAGQPDLEATRLADQLSQLFGNIVNSVMTTDSTSPWPFWDDLFKAQIAVLPGSRAIVAVHDLDVPPSADKTANRKCIELKFQRMQDYVRETDCGGKLKFFWAALIYKNAKALPFAQYPYDGRFKDWRLLSFERAEGGSDAEQPVRPAPASLGAFRAQLSKWATN